MALKHAILSALSRGAPLLGYGLNNVFSDQNERVWHASASQVYSELIKMEKAGLISIEERNERGHTSYVITSDGLQELRRWLSFTEPDHTIRDDSLLRLMTLWVLDETTARHLIEAEIAFQRKRLAHLQLRIDEYPGIKGNAKVWRNRLAVHYLWRAQTDLYIAWLEALPQVLEDPAVPVAELMDELRRVAAEP